MPFDVNAMCSRFGTVVEVTEIVRVNRDADFDEDDVMRVVGEGRVVALARATDNIIKVAAIKLGSKGAKMALESTVKVVNAIGSARIGQAAAHEISGSKEPLRFKALTGLKALKSR